MRPIISRLHLNCVPKHNRYMGTNGMGQPVYAIKICKPCRMETKLVRKRVDEKTIEVRQYTFYTVPQGWAIGDTLTLDSGESVIIESINGNSLLEVIAYGGNKN